MLVNHTKLAFSKETFLELENVIYSCSHFFLLNLVFVFRCNGISIHFKIRMAASAMDTPQILFSTGKIVEENSSNITQLHQLDGPEVNGIDHRCRSGRLIRLSEHNKNTSWSYSSLVVALKTESRIKLNWLGYWKETHCKWTPFKKSVATVETTYEVWAKQLSQHRHIVKDALKHCCAWSTTALMWPLIK